MEALQTRRVENNYLRRETVYPVRESTFTHIVDSTVARSFHKAFHQLPDFAASFVDSQAQQPREREAFSI